MKTFSDDIQHDFLPRYGALAQVMLANIILYIVLGLLGLIFALGGSYRIFEGWIREYLSVRSNLGSLLLKPWTIITYGFFHIPVDIFHILFNMLWLYWIGKILYENISNRNAHIWTIYMLGVLAGALTFIVSMNIFPLFANSSNYYANGASAGVTAIVVAAATLLPNYSIYLMLFGAVKLKWLALVLVLLDIILIPASNAGGHIAHIGGAALGYIYINQLQKGSDWSIIYDKIVGLFSKPNTYRPQMQVIKTNAGINSESNKSTPSQQEVDRILDKIQLVGYENLSLEEKQTLHKASTNKQS